MPSKATKIMGFFINARNLGFCEENLKVFEIAKGQKGDVGCV